MYAVVASALGLCLCLKFSALRAGLHQPQTSIDNRLRRDLESSLALAIPISMIGGIVLAVVIYDTRSGTAS